MYWYRLQIKWDYKKKETSYTGVPSGLKTISTPFLYQKQMPSAFWQADVCLNIFSACLVDVCASTALTAL
jgi:hypothetical protein